MYCPYCKKRIRLKQEYLSQYWIAKCDCAEESHKLREQAEKQCLVAAYQKSKEGKMIYIGVDPGMTGAIALIDNSQVIVEDFENKSALIELKIRTENLKKNNLDYGALNDAPNCLAYVEKVHSFPGQGVSTTFKFGKAAGQVIGWLEALGIPYEEITPTKWQKMVYDSGTKTGDNKADSLTMARKLFPSMLGRLKRKKDHNRAEALLIAEACRRSRLQ
jgi:hypothetical protein